jgi:hypothetical protein
MEITLVDFSSIDCPLQVVLYSSELLHYTVGVFFIADFPGAGSCPITLLNHVGAEIGQKN